MDNFILIHEATIRLAFFIGVLCLMAIWEKVAPRRSLNTPKRLRWLANIGLVSIDTLAIRLLLPMQVMGIALLAENRGWGILNNVSLPYWMAVVIGISALDFAIYLQHNMFHAIPAFWRLHSMHHTDLDFDVTTGVRFHPIEILLSMGIKMAAAVILGASAVAVVLFGFFLMPPACSIMGMSDCLFESIECCDSRWSRRRCTAYIIP